MTPKLHDALLLLASMAVHMTSVDPTAKLDPDGGTQVMFTGPEVSAAFRSGQVTSSGGLPGSTIMVKLV